jgi:hypothetical protein
MLGGDYKHERWLLLWLMNLWTKMEHLWIFMSGIISPMIQIQKPVSDQCWVNVSKVGNWKCCVRNWKVIGISVKPTKNGSLYLYSLGWRSNEVTPALLVRHVSPWPHSSPNAQPFARWLSPSQRTEVWPPGSRPPRRPSLCRQIQWNHGQTPGNEVWCRGLHLSKIPSPPQPRYMSPH